MFSSWYIENVESTDATFSSTDMSSHDLDLLVVDAIDRLMTGGISQEHDVFANLTPRELRARRRDDNRQVITDQSKRQDDSTSISPDQSENEEVSKSDHSPSSENLSTECQRTLNHPLHTIATAPPPLPIEKWAPLQNSEDIPSNMMRIPKEEVKEGLPRDLIILQDKKGHKRILVPECQRIALTRMEHETMLHLKGNRVHHELSRSYFWPHMAEKIKLLYNACKVCQQALVQRQNLSATFRQADEKDLPLPRQAYGIDFYGHEKGEILVAVDLCTREAMFWFLPNRKQENVARALMTAHPSKGCPINIPQ
jgi:hypothetical protein